MTPAEPATRHAARAVLLDARDRILLFENEIPERPRRRAWYLPGGRLEDGETHEEALARELLEEVGLRDAAIGPCVWTRESVRYRGDVPVPSHSRFHVVRCECFDVDTSGGGVESGLEWRWWTLDELEAAPARSFIPTSLPMLVRAIVAGDIPTEPVDARD